MQQDGERYITFITDKDKCEPWDLDDNDNTQKNKQQTLAAVTTRRRFRFRRRRSSLRSEGPLFIRPGRQVVPNPGGIFKMTNGQPVFIQTNEHSTFEHA